MQRKLTEGEIEKLKQARSGISDVLFPAYGDHGQYWAEVLFLLGDNIKHGTNDGRPWVEPEPPLTDQDAAVWPRLLVMVRDDESKPWRGPVELHGICPGSGFPFSYMGINDKLRGIAVYARRATPEEIKSMNRK